METVLGESWQTMYAQGHTHTQGAAMEMVLGERLITVMHAQGCMRWHTQGMPWSWWLVRG
eukprot:1151724-Pelagomonas_calceolata.AAC.1